MIYGREIKPEDLPRIEDDGMFTKFKAEKYLNNEEDISLFLEMAKGDGDSKHYEHCLQVAELARAKPDFGTESPMHDELDGLDLYNITEGDRFNGKTNSD